MRRWRRSGPLSETFETFSATMTFSILRLSEVSNQSMLPETSETIEASQTLETLDTSDFLGCCNF